MSWRSRINTVEFVYEVLAPDILPLELIIEAGYAEPAKRLRYILHVRTVGPGERKTHIILSGLTIRNSLFHAPPLRPEAPTIVRGVIRSTGSLSSRTVRLRLDGRNG